MTTIAQARERLVDDLLEGDQIGRTHLTDIIGERIELDTDDLANMLNGSVEWFMDRQRALRQAAQPLVESYVDHDPRGKTLLAERCEKLLHEREDDLSYELTEQKSREQAGECWANPIGLSCGCTFDRGSKDYSRECEAHEGLQEKVA